MKNPLFPVYEKLPVAVQNAAMSMYGWYLYRQRYGKVYRQTLQWLAGLDTTDRAAMQRLQEERWQEFLRYAVEHSAYYRNAYRDIDLSRVQAVDAIDRLPILEKETLRQQLSRFYTVDKSKAVLSYTGGTTGKPLEIRYHPDDLQRRMAYLHFWEGSLGISQKDKRATFNGRQLVARERETQVFWRYNAFRHQMLYSTFHMTEDHLPLYAASLNRFQPAVINGFVSAIYQLASYLLQTGTPVTFQPKAVLTTSETLLPYQRQTIEQAFGCPVRNQYASSEGAPFVVECACGNLHYLWYTGIIESYPTAQGTEMLVTGFDTRGTPLIRYRIGDMWEPSGDTCPCGSCFPVVRRVEGRAVDYLVSPRYGKVSLAHLADVIKGLPSSVVNTQYVQKEPTVIHIRMVVDRALFTAEDQRRIVEEMAYRFGDDMRFDIEIVDHIEREPSGKYRLIKNELTP